MKFIRNLWFLSLFCLLTGGCSLFTAQPTPSNQVLAEVRNAETAYLLALTAITIGSNGHVSADVKQAEEIVYLYLQEAKASAKSGDTVTVEQKLELFNSALREFNETYVKSKQP